MSSLAPGRPRQSRKSSWNSLVSTASSPRASFSKSISLVRDLLFPGDPSNVLEEAVSDDEEEEAPAADKTGIAVESEEEEEKDGKEKGEEEKEKPAPRFIASIDQGTTSSRFIIFDERGRPVVKHQVELGRIHSQPGWHEQDPIEILQSVEKCVGNAVAKFNRKGFSVKDIATIGLTSQRETTVVWDWESGRPLHNPIAWPDTRTGTLVREFKQAEGAEKIGEICGLPLSTYSSSVKLVWLLRNSPEVRQAYDEGRLAFGTVDTWLLFHLNGGSENKVHVTDVTNASRTMFTNLHTLQYDDYLLKFFGIDITKVRMPTILSSSHPTGFGRVYRGPLRGISITSCLGDQSAALVGHTAFRPGMAKNTYGTGCFLLYNVGEQPVISKNGLLGTVAYQLGPDKPITYALEGSIAVAGSGVSFLMNNMGFFQDPRKVDEQARTVSNNGGCIFVTAFSGLFAPYWIDDAKGTIFGITHHTQRGHIARATLEAVCFQTKAILQAMERDSGKTLSSLAVDGGLSMSDVCMQSQANIIRIPVERPAMHEITSLGSAIAAGIAIGKFASPEDALNMKAADRMIFEHTISVGKSDKLFRQWSKAVEMCRGWVDDDNLDDDDE